MSILRRYILREHVGPLLFALATLTSLLLLNQIAKQFGNLVGKGLSWSVIGEFFLLSMPFIIAMTLPMAVLVATLYAFSRLAAENEITALKASGVGHFRIIRPVLLGAAGVALVMIWFNDQVLPRANHKLSTLQMDIGRTKPTFALREQAINEVSPGQLYLRAGHIDEATNRLREVTIFDLSDPQRRRTIHADSGLMQLAPNHVDLELTLHDGYSQEIPRDNPTEMQRLYFHTDVVRVKGIAQSFSRTEDKGYKSDREMSICEMQDEVRNAERERRAAREDLASALANAAHALATGETRPVEPASPVVDPISLGMVYCRYILPLVSLNRAEAAELPAHIVGAVAVQAPRQDPRPRREPPPIALPQDTGAAARKAAAARSTRAPGLNALPQSLRGRLVPDGQATPAQAPGGQLPSPTLAPGSRPVRSSPINAFANARGQIDVAQTRLTQARMDQSQYEVEIEKKFALSAACVIFVLLGAPIALRFPRGGVGLVIGVSLIVFALYYVGLIMGETLADKLILSPFWAMWMANILFGGVGLYLLYMLRRGGGNARGGELREIWDGLARRLARRRAERSPALRTEGAR